MMTSREITFEEAIHLSLEPNQRHTLETKGQIKQVQYFFPKQNKRIITKFCFCKQPQLYTMCKYESRAQNPHSNRVRAWLISTKKFVVMSWLCQVSQPQNTPCDAKGHISHLVLDIGLFDYQSLESLQVDVLESRDQVQDSTLVLCPYPLQKVLSLAVHHRIFQAFIFKGIALPMRKNLQDQNKVKLDSNIFSFLPRGCGFEPKGKLQLYLSKFYPNGLKCLGLAEVMKRENSFAVELCTNRLCS